MEVDKNWEVLDLIFRFEKLDLFVVLDLFKGWWKYDFDVDYVDILFYEFVDFILELFSDLDLR